MTFVLTYRGPLPSSASEHALQIKQQIRVVFGRQLAELCKQDPRFADALEPVGTGVTLVTIKGRELQIPRPLPSRFFALALDDFCLIPLVTRAHELVCSLDIGFLRREAPGAIYSGGDIDNRIKNLLDALRIPQSERELQGAAPTHRGDRLYCLLEDDSLIADLTISTDRLLTPFENQEKETDVDVRIRVTVEGSYPMWGNIGMGFPIR